MINSLSQLKRELQKGKRFIVLNHQKPDLIGTVREVNIVQGNAIYTKIADNPGHKHSTCNGGRGLRMDYAKSNFYEFGDSIKWFASSVGTEGNKLIMEFKLM